MPFYVGIDWATEAHAVAVLDRTGRIRWQASVAHSAAGLAELVRRLKRLAPPAQIRIALERPSGLLVDTLVEAGFAVVPIHPNALKATRPRYSAAGAKSDPGDAFILADVLRTDSRRFRPLTTPTDATPMKRFDLMFGVNVRGTYLCTQACLPHLVKSAQAGRNPHVLNMSPPLSMKPRWFAPHVAYTMAKYGMSECTLGHAAEFAPLGIAVNSLWPRTAIATAALQMIPGVDPARCRTPEILADAAYYVLTSDARRVSGNFFIDDALLAAHGVTDLDRYSVTPGTTDFIPDFFVD